jgi:hypothetical protein
MSDELTSVFLLPFKISSGADLLRHTVVKQVLVLDGLVELALVNLTG